MVILAALLLGGCASINDVNITKHEMEALGKAIGVEETRLEGLEEGRDKATAEIVKVDNATAGEKILGVALVNQSYVGAAKSKVADIVARFKRATLGTDVQLEGVKQVGANALPISWTVVEVKKSNEPKGDVSITTEGDVSYNQENNRATSIGDSNDTSTTVKPSTETTATTSGGEGYAPEY